MSGNTAVHHLPLTLHTDPLLTPRVRESACNVAPESVWCYRHPADQWQRVLSEEEAEPAPPTDATIGWAARRRNIRFGCASSTGRGIGSFQQLVAAPQVFPVSLLPDQVLLPPHRAARGQDRPRTEGGGAACVSFKRRKWLVVVTGPRRDEPASSLPD